MRNFFFTHQLVDKVDLNDRFVDGTRYYFLPSGEKFKSVTSVLGDKMDKTGLIEWRKRVGDDEANRVSKIATERGKAIHRMAENCVLNKEYNDGESIFNVDLFDKLAKVLYEHVDNVLGVEIPLFSRVLKTAGRTDLVAEWDGVPSVIDFKTSKKLKNEDWIESYFLQASCYAMMFSMIYKRPVEQIVIVIAVDDEPTQVFVKSVRDYAGRVLEIFAD